MLGITKINFFFSTALDTKPNKKDSNYTKQTRATTTIFLTLVVTGVLQNRQVIETGRVPNSVFITLMTCCCD